MSKLIQGLTWHNTMTHVACPFCEGTLIPDDCEDCEDTDRDTIPWAELFIKGRTWLWDNNGPARER